MKLEHDIINDHFIRQILDQLPICSDVQIDILSYISRPLKICTFLSYKLIRLGNVQSLSAIVRKSKQLDTCKALLKSFDSIWDLFSSYLIKDDTKDKDIIEYWYNRCKI